MTALAMLCYAKAYANKKGEFGISSVDMANWLEIPRTTLSRYVRELIEYRYLRIVERKEKRYSWGDDSGTKSNRYRLEVSIGHNPSVMLVDNNVSDLYDAVF